MRPSIFQLNALCKNLTLISALTSLPALTLAQGGPVPADPLNSIAGLTQIIKNRNAAHPLLQGASDPLSARLYRLRMHALPFDRVDPQANDRLQQQLAAVPRATSTDILGLTKGVPYASAPNAPYATMSVSAAALAPLTAWKNIGPVNLDPPYRLYFGPVPVAGRVDAVAFDPKVSGVYYLGAAAGGVWKTTDAGVNWTPLFNNLPSKQAGQSVNSIAIDPKNNNVVYAGTGDADGGDSFAFGLWRSTDGGSTWALMGSNPADRTNVSQNRFGYFPIRKVVIDPADPSGKTILLGTRNGLWRTTNGGQNFGDWTSVLGGVDISNIVLDANPDPTKQVIFASVDGNGIFQSANRGQTWTSVDTLNGTISNAIRVDMAASKLDPKTVYVLTVTLQDPFDYGSGFGNLFKTTDGGVTWKDITPLPLALADWTQASFYDFYLASSYQTLSSGKGSGISVSSDTLYVGLKDLLRSSDGGKTFASAALCLTGGALAHTDQHSFAVNPNNPNDMLIGNDGGVNHFIYSPVVGTSQFFGLNKNLTIAQFYALATHPLNPNKMLGGTQDNSTPHMDGDPAHWLNPGAGDGFAALMNPTDALNPITAKQGPQNQYNTSQNIGIRFTDDDWATTADCSPALANDVAPFATPMGMNPGNPNLIYTGTQYLYTGTHVPPVAPATIGTVTWAEGSMQYCSRGVRTDPAPFDLPFPFFITSIAPAATIVPQKIFKGNVYVGCDDGSVWAGVEQIDRMGKPGGLPALFSDGVHTFGSPISQIFVSPANPKPHLCRYVGRQRTECLAL